MTLMNKLHGAASTAAKPCKKSLISPNCRRGHSTDVAFHTKRFAFAISFRTAQAYMTAINEPAPLHDAKATRLSNRMEIHVKFFSRLFARREINLTTALERQRLSRTMPGQTGAVAAARLGFVA
jgi:hypothetical protein